MTCDACSKAREFPDLQDFNCKQCWARRVASHLKQDIRKAEQDARYMAEGFGLPWEDVQRWMERLEA